MVMSTTSRAALFLYILCDLFYFLVPLVIAIWGLLWCLNADIVGYEFFSTAWVALSQISMTFVGGFVVYEQILEPLKSFSRDTKLMSKWITISTCACCKKQNKVRNKKSQ